MILSDNTTIIIFIFIIIFVFIFIVIVNSSEYSGSRAGSLFGQWEKPEKVLLLDPVPIAPCLPLCIILHKVFHCVLHCLHRYVQSRLYWTVHLKCDKSTVDRVLQWLGKSNLVCIAQHSAHCGELFVLHSRVESAKAASPFNPIKTHPGQRATLHRRFTTAVQFFVLMLPLLFCVKINFAPLRWTALLMLHLIEIALLHCSTFSCIAYCCKAFYWMALIISILMLMLVLPYFFPA